jgi:glycosyltransferase involved in cell wall biosynthesis
VTRPVVLTLSAYYLPGYKAGGPIRTIQNLVSSLGDEFDFRIFTSDRDLGQPRPYDGVSINEWNDHVGATVFYADANARRPSRLAATIHDVAPDIVYINSFFNPRFSISPLFMRWLGFTSRRIAWIVAPRGEFSRNALMIKALKKRAYISSARMFGLLDDVFWQASSPFERDDIIREFGASPDSICIAPNLSVPVAASCPPAPSRGASNRLSVCFLARVCVMKNLAFAIEALADCSIGVDLHIYGPVEDEAYAETCRRLVPGDASRLSVTWHGEVPHDQVRLILARHDIFFLPTLGENFGHVIFEALAAGVPVLLSDRTPWRDLDAAGVGWVRPLGDHQPFVQAIQDYASLDADARAAMRCRAHAYAAQIAASEDARDANRRMFTSALDRASRRS